MVSSKLGSVNVWGSNGTRREADVHKINDSKEYLAAFASKYRKMEFRLDAFENAQVEAEQNAA